uniref:Uncharacterized protein n=1 Tax=viral metagenome TaxID=1070528 RepID=A0A6H1ZKB1_9ZZZZ
MATRAKRDVRFDALRNYHAMYVAGIHDIDASKRNVEFTGHCLFKSELEKFQEKHPDVEMESFTQFLKETGGFRDKGKRPGTGKGGGKTLNTVEKAEQIGVAPENIETYVTIINNVYDSIDALRQLVTKGRVSFAIPLIKEKDSGGIPE